MRKGGQLLCVVEHRGMQRQAHRHRQYDAKCQAVKMLRDDGGHNATASQAFAEAVSQQAGFAIQADDVLNHPARRSRGAGGEQLDEAVFVNLRQGYPAGDRLVAGGYHNQLPVNIEGPIAQDAAKQRLLLLKQRNAAMAGNDRRFTGMQRGQQRNDKQVAVFKAQRPALAFLLTQGVDQ